MTMFARPDPKFNLNPFEGIGEIRMLQLKDLTPELIRRRVTESFSAGSVKGGRFIARIGGLNVPMPYFWWVRRSLILDVNRASSGNYRFPVVTVPKKLIDAIKQRNQKRLLIAKSAKDGSVVARIHLRIFDWCSRYRYLFIKPAFYLSIDLNQPAGPFTADEKWAFMQERLHKPDVRLNAD